MVSQQYTVPENNNERYNSELSIIDSLYAFHPEAFELLSKSEMEALQKYYLLGEPVPDDVFAYREDIVTDDADLAGRAQIAFQNVCRKLGIEDIHYPS